MNTKCSIFTSGGEIKFDLTLKKSNFLFLLCFYKFTIIKLLPTRRLSRQKTNFFPSHFASTWSFSACLGGIVLGKYIVLYLENEAK